MPIWSKKSGAKKLRIFYVTDVHGSEPTFRKFINAGKIYEVDALVLGGDITGKMMIPIIDLGNADLSSDISRYDPNYHSG